MGFDPIVAKRILTIGDSKTGSQSWVTTLATNLTTATAGNPTWASDNVGVAASTASYWATNIATVLAGQTQNHTHVLVNLGVNDFGSATEAAWIADMQAVLDAVRAKWPQTVVYVTKPWKRNFDATADTYAGWVDTLVASRSTFAVVGDDERSWLKGADNGAANTTDGIHYSAAGQTAAAAAKKTAMGY